MNTVWIVIGRDGSVSDGYWYLDEAAASIDQVPVWSAGMDGMTGHGYGPNPGYGVRSGSGDESGYGFASGSGDGSGAGAGYRFGTGSGYGSPFKSGNGSGCAPGYGSGSGSGNG